MLLEHMLLAAVVVVALCGGVSFFTLRPLWRVPKLLKALNKRLDVLAARLDAATAESKGLVSILNSRLEKADQIPSYLDGLNKVAGEWVRSVDKQAEITGKLLDAMFGDSGQAQGQSLSGLPQTSEFGRLFGEPNEQDLSYVMELMRRRNPKLSTEEQEILAQQELQSGDMEAV